MEYSIEELNNLSSKEIKNVIKKDQKGDGEILFALENELMELIREHVFSDSETFGDLDEESASERTIRVLIESLDFMATLGAINAISNSQEEAY